MSPLMPVPSAARWAVPDRAMTPATRVPHFGSALTRLCDGVLPLGIGVAVSGGGDSVAVLLAAVDWARRRKAAVFVVTVNHGLRPAAADEAAFVADLCSELGVAHQILDWTERPASGNLQMAARDARIRLIGAWARELELRHVVLGHTLDDQAETVLMRLARGSGVDGLAAMSARRVHNDIVWLRPFLDVRRADLRHFLDARGQGWIDDPSNDDTRFDRVKMRQALELLAPMGVDADQLARTAEHMADARDALNIAAQKLARSIGAVDHGDVVIDQSGLAEAPFDLRARLMAHAMGWVASNAYKPRFRSLDTVMKNLADGRTQTLHGCLLSARRGHIRITREFNAVELMSRPAARQIWDTRWRLTGPAQDGDTIAPLGEIGLRMLDDPGPLPRSSRVSLPAIWRNETLIAAPLPKNNHEPPTNWGLDLCKGAEDFYASITAD
jgi:tRNA(Ile)-lysidine synthase